MISINWHKTVGHEKDKFIYQRFDADTCKDKYRRLSMFEDFLSANFLIHISKWSKMTIFQSKIDYLSVNSRFLVQNDGTWGKPVVVANNHA